MTQYQSKRRVINATQWQPGIAIPGTIEATDGAVFAHTRAGKVLLVARDYVISGGARVMSAADFEAEYEPVEKEKPAQKAVQQSEQEKKRLAKNKRARERRAERKAAEKK